MTQLTRYRKSRLWARFRVIKSAIDRYLNNRIHPKVLTVITGLSCLLPLIICFAINRDSPHGFPFYFLSLGYSLILFAVIYEK